MHLNIKVQNHVQEVINQYYPSNVSDYLYSKYTLLRQVKLGNKMAKDRFEAEDVDRLNFYIEKMIKQQYKKELSKRGSEVPIGEHMKLGSIVTPLKEDEDVKNADIDPVNLHDMSGRDENENDKLVGDASMGKDDDNHINPELWKMFKHKQDDGTDRGSNTDEEDNSEEDEDKDDEAFDSDDSDDDGLAITPRSKGADSDEVVDHNKRKSLGPTSGLGGKSQVDDKSSGWV